jgi:hypothetical protein
MHENADERQVALFELPDAVLGRQLYLELRDRWTAWIATRDGLRFVAVLLDRDELSTRVLVETVATWAEEAGLGFVRFHVRGRTFVVSAEGDRSDRS